MSLEAKSDSKFNQIQSPNFSQKAPRINQEIDNKLNEFIKEHPKLEGHVKAMPREYLERKYLLAKMEQRDRNLAYNNRVAAWLNDPEQAEIKKTLEKTLPKLSSTRAEATVLTQAKNYLKNSGIKIR